MTIIDPLNINNNITETSYRIRDIFNLFNMIYYRIVDKISDFDKLITEGKIQQSTSDLDLAEKEASLSNSKSDDISEQTNILSHIFQIGTEK
jgi:hypothetical protein